MNTPRMPAATTPVEKAAQHRSHGPIADGLLPLARRHRGALGRGLAFSTLLVGARLALPLPLQQVVDRGASAPGGVATSGQVTALSAVFVGLALAAGVAEHFQRLAFAAFAGRTVSDARAAALAGLPDDGDPAGTTARVLGDSLRVKQGLKGVLNHITVSGLLTIGVCIAIALADATAGLLVATGSVLVLLIALVGARKVGGVAARHRQQEVALAATVHQLVSEAGSSHDIRIRASLRELDAISGEADIGLTRWEGLTTGAATVVLTLTTAMTMLVGVHAAQRGAMDAGTLFAVMAYLLVLLGPAIRSVRQITRTAPLLVSARELGRVLLRSRGPTVRQREVL